MAADDDIYAGERKVGRVTSALRWPDGSYAGLALVKGVAADETLDNGGGMTPSTRKIGATVNGQRLEKLGGDRGKKVDTSRFSRAIKLGGLATRVSGSFLKRQMKKIGSQKEDLIIGRSSTRQC